MLLAGLLLLTATNLPELPLPLKEHLLCLVHHFSFSGVMAGGC